MWLSFLTCLSQTTTARLLPLDFLLDKSQLLSLCVSSPSGSSSMEFSRQEYWSGLPFLSPGDLPNSGIRPGSPALQVGSFPSEPPVKSYIIADAAYLHFKPYLLFFLCLVSCSSVQALLIWSCFVLLPGITRMLMKEPLHNSNSSTYKVYEDFIRREQNLATWLCQFLLEVSALFLCRHQLITINIC